MAVSNYLGVALSFASPQLVPFLNTTGDAGNTDATQKHVRELLWIQTIASLVVLAGALIYFPDRPADAPSRSATADRTAFWNGLRDLLHHKQFWLLACSYGVMTGIYSGWGAFLAPNLDHIHALSPKQRDGSLASNLGLYATLAGAVGGVGVGVVAASLARRAKRILLALCVLSGGMYLWFALKCVTTNADESGLTVQLYAACVLGGLFLNGTIPLFYETAVETTFPIGEGSTVCMLTIMNNLGCLIFLFLPNIGALTDHPMWANWALVAGCAVGFGSLIPFAERYRRSDYDEDEALPDPEAASPLLGDGRAAIVN